jgi:recombination protein RecT
MTDKNTAIAQSEASMAERFTGMVMKQYAATGKYQPTEREKQLIRNYFICIDQTLQKAEAERLRKNANNRDSKYNNELAYTWNNVDLQALALDLAHYARVGLDMMEDNTLFPIPYKNSKGNKYSMTLMEGYNGIRFQAEKYALDPFKAVTVEVIYANDKFRPIKKDSRNPVEGYEFDIPQPFDRGEPVGVFGYIEFEDPSKNKLVVFSKADVMKRKPKYASPEFWGGKKKVWENGRQVEVELEGWVSEMYEKTMKREIYGSKRIPRDPDKVDESYNYIRQREQQYEDMVIEAEIVQNANASPIQLPEEPEPKHIESAAAELPPVEEVEAMDDFDANPDF